MILPDYILYDYECYMLMSIGELEGIEARLTGESNVYPYSRNTQIYFSAYEIGFKTCEDLLNEIAKAGVYEKTTKIAFDKQFVSTMLEEGLLETIDDLILLSTEILNGRNGHHGQKKNSDYSKELEKVLDEIESENEIINTKKSQFTWAKALDYFNQFRFVDDIMDNYFNVELESEKEMINKIEDAMLKKKKWFIKSERLLEKIYAVARENLPECLSGRYYVHIPYAYTVKAKQRGAAWDKKLYMYYFTDASDAWKFYQWL